MGSTEAGPISQVTGSTPLASGVRADIIMEGNGWFTKYKKHYYIVTTAQKTLAPPTLLSGVNRYPLPGKDPNPIGENGQIRNVYTRPSRILVTVYNNHHCKSYVYEAEYHGVSGSSDLAVLKIMSHKTSAWNRCNPKIKRPAYYQWGQSCQLDLGDEIKLIGDYIASPFHPNLINMAQGLTKGVVSDARHLDYGGWMLQETLVVSTPVYKGKVGLPILNRKNEVVGMITSNLAENSPGYVSGPTQFFMQPVVKALIKGMTGKNRNRIDVVHDNVGSFFIYLRSYIGLAYKVFTGVDYDLTSDFTSGGPELAAPKIRLDSNGKFLSSPRDKQIAGIEVLGLAGLNPNFLPGVVNGFYYVPGGTGTAPLVTDPLPVSPLIPRIKPGDLIYKIGSHLCCDLGDLEDQIAPSIILWKTPPGSSIEIHYRTGGSAPNNADNSLGPNYDDNNCITVQTERTPPVMDWPWYAIDTWPKILMPALGPYPSFVGPATQSLTTLLPELNTPDVSTFHPAI
jgi:hypothetical protein